MLLRKISCIVEIYQQLSNSFHPQSKGKKIKLKIKSNEKIKIHNNHKIKNGNLKIYLVAMNVILFDKRTLRTLRTPIQIINLLVLLVRNIYHIY